MRLKRRRSPPPTPTTTSLSSSSSASMFRSSFSTTATNGTSSDASGDISSSSETSAFFRRSIAIFVVFAFVVFTWNSFDSFRFLSFSSSSISSATSLASLRFVFPPDNYTDVSLQDRDEHKLERVLKNAVTEENTVIITTLNEAWAASNSIIDLFLESFRLGLHTRKFLNHLVIVALDDKAFKRCLAIHTHCFPLVTEGIDFSKEAYFMTPDYLKMMWRRIDFLRSVLEMGYSFIFTDADIMWFRDPFTHLSPDADFQIACDHFTGDSSDVNNKPNGGFNYVKSNNRSIEFYKFWYSSQENYPGYHDQDVLNFIKDNPYIEEIGLKMEFLDTSYFGGFCEPSEDLNQVCTMHANCCFGMDSKLHDLKILLEDWRLFMSLPPTLKRTQMHSWSVPKNCSLRSLRPHKIVKESDEQQEEVDTEENEG